jgi:hypothetical protein
MQPLAEPEPQRVDGLEVGAVVECSDSGDEATDLVDGEDVREPLLPGDTETLEGRPITRNGVRREELDPAVSDAEGRGGELADVLEVEEVVAELLFGEPVRRGLEVVGELPDGAELGLLSAFGESGELEVVEQALTQRRDHVKVLWQGVKKSPLPGTLAHDAGACHESTSQ